MRQIRIAHVISGLGTGGSEVMLLKLLSAMDGKMFASSVISLNDSSREPIWGAIQNLGIPLSTMRIRPSLPNPAYAWRLRKILRESKADIVQGWGVHGDFAVYAARQRPFLFNVRNSLDSLEAEKLSTRTLIRFLGRASTKAAAVIFNSRYSARQHEAIGYRAAQSRIIPNGFDCGLFRPDDESRRKVRKELGIADSTFVAGHVARYHKIKDHATSIEAFSILCNATPDSCLVMAGLNVDDHNSEIASLVARFGIRGKVRLLGRRTDVPALNAAFDVAVSSSGAEAFANAIGEAMACGVPCVVTDVGDSAWIVGDTGFAVPVRDPRKLAAAMISISQMSGEARTKLGREARARVERDFSLDGVANQYQKLYEEIAAGNAARPAGLS